MTRHTFASLKRRLVSAGFKKDFIQHAILPDWWDDDCGQDQSLLPDIDIRVARFLGLDLSVVRDPTASLSIPLQSGARLRRVRDINADRLSPAIHAAIQIAGAVTRCMSPASSKPSEIPVDGLTWRTQIKRDNDSVSLQDILGDLWGRSIPVVPLDVLPTPSFQGLACIVHDRPIILLGHKHDEPGRIAFVIAHEVGHISSRDCTPDHPVVDEEGQIIDNSEMEKLADQYATSLLVGEHSFPTLKGKDYRQLAQSAADFEGETGVDASMIIYAWASRTSNYAQASMATKALYRASGARRQLRNHFESNVNIREASETDRALLRCVYGIHERNADSD